MPWEKSFDVKKVRVQAMDFFWIHGFESASMTKLLQHLGINRGSFYATFDSKKKLFFESLQLYVEQQLFPVLEAAEPLPAREAVHVIFDAFLAAAMGPMNGYGCFLVNSSLELGKQNKEVDTMLKTTITHVEDFLEQKLLEGQKKGEISNCSPARDIGSTLTALIFGMRSLERTGASEETLRSICKQAERLLD